MNDLEEKIKKQAINDEKNFAKWLNEWGDFNVYSKRHKNNKITNWGVGYKQAIQDVIRKLNFMGIDIFDYL